MSNGSTLTSSKRMEVSVPGVPIDPGVVATSEVLVDREHNPKSDGDDDLESERVSITKRKKQTKRPLETNVGLCAVVYFQRHAILVKLFYKAANIGGEAALPRFR